MIHQTSLEAYFQVQEQLGERQLEVLKALRELKEGNNLMISTKLGLPINSITPRVLELRTMGLVVEAYKDRCPITKRMTIFWRIR